MEKNVDMSKMVHNLCRENSEVADVMKELGLENITNPAVLNTAGRFITNPRGAVMKGVELGKIKEDFVKSGFVIKG